MDFWINALKVVSIIAAGLFGTLGLLTKYKDENKITRWGKIALGGIMFSALLSLTLQLLQTSKEAAQHQEAAIKSSQEAKKAEEAATATSEKLKNILETAQNTSDQQTRNLAQAEVITEKMDNSLKTQREVLSGNRKILEGVVEGARRDTENTIGILRTIWDESNRVNADQITVAIRYTFAKKLTAQPPLLLDSEETLSFSAVTQDSARSLSVPLKKWSTGGLLKKPELQLGGLREQRVTQKRFLRPDDTAEAIRYQQFSYFSKFEGDLGIFSDMTKWNGALIEVVLTKLDPSLISKLMGCLDWTPDQTKGLEELKLYHDIPEDLESNAYSITLPVRATLMVLLRGRPIATSDTMLVAVRQNENDSKGLIVAKFSIAKVAENTFPEFKPTALKASEYLR